MKAFLFTASNGSKQLTASRTRYLTHEKDNQEAS